MRDATFSCPDLNTRSVALTSSVSKPSASGSNQTVQCWRAGSSTRTSGVVAADVRALRATR